jgi:hypothetical protein
MGRLMKMVFVSAAKPTTFVVKEVPVSIGSRLRRLMTLF